MNELLNNIDWNGAGVLFFYFVLVLVIIVTGLGSIFAFLEANISVSPWRWLLLGVVLLLVSIGGTALLFGGIP